MTDNKVVKQMLDRMDTVEDLKQFASAQYSTIIVQSQKINELETKIAELEVRNQQLETSATVNSALSPNQLETSDTETACLVQIALLKNLAMNRELTLEECKKLEIFAKTLQMVRGKPTDEGKKKKEDTKRLSNDELLAMMDEAMKIGE